MTHPLDSHPEISQHPYFVKPLIDLLGQTSDPELQQAIRQRIAVNIPDPEALRTLLGIDPQEFLNFYPDQNAPKLSTDDAIDTFLQQYSQPATPQPLAIGAADYDLTQIEPTETSARDAIPADDPTFSCIDAFLADNPSPTPRKQKAAAEPAAQQEPAASADVSDTTLSESLARIMVKNGNYSKALEILTDINLKNPEKSIYFADQIRFLRKLIANQSKI